jgi:hypothetical protein
MTATGALVALRIGVAGAGVVLHAASSRITKLRAKLYARVFIIH